MHYSSEDISSAIHDFIKKRHSSAFRTGLIVSSVFRFLLILLICGACGSIKAAIITATNASLNAVQTAVNSANPGDTINVPAGTATWTTNLAINNNISMVGAGIGKTIIIDEVPRSGFDGLIRWNTISNYTECELSGFQFQGGVINTGAEIPCEVTFYGDCPVCRVTGCLFQDLHAGSIWFAAGAYGCVDHCQFYDTNFEDQIYCENGDLGGIPANDSGGYGDEMWAQPADYGSTNNWIYMEYNQIAYPPTMNGYAIDGCQGTKMVFRFNNVTNAYLQDHGTESSQRYRSGRAMEVYGNTFTEVGVYSNDVALMFWRGGSGIVYSNTMWGYAMPFVNFLDLRATTPVVPWGAANGLNSFDTNVSLVLTSTNSSANGSYYAVDNINTYAVGQFVGGYGSNTNCAYILIDATQHGTNSFESLPSSQNFGLIGSNGTHQLYGIYNTYGSYNNGCIAWTNGDIIKIYKIQASIDQPGRGSGDLIEDYTYGAGNPYDTVTGRTNWPNEGIDGIYFLSNTINGSLTSEGANIGYINNGLGVGNYNIIIDGRDYFDNTPMPGYNPLGVHPLDSTNSVSTSPSFILTVIDGTGTYSYTNGAIAPISANEADTVSNGVFGFWSGSCIANTNSASTTVTMPASNLTVTAVYYPTPPPPPTAVPGQ
jgi:hypothetical protein